MKLKMKMWSLTVQCKAIATLVIIAQMLDSNDNNSKVSIHQEIKIHIFWKRFLVKTFAILAEPSWEEPIHF